MELLQMSKKELSRVEVMERMKTKKMTQKKGAEALGISVRQIRRLRKRYEEKGAAGLVNKSRGKPSNNCLPIETRQRAIDLLELFLNRVKYGEVKHNPIRRLRRDTRNTR